MQHAIKFFKEEDGLAVTEYGLLLTLIAVAVAAVVKTFGEKLQTAFSNASDQLTATP
jgi:pilus assembly protein Flp/PilA